MNIYRFHLGLKAVLRKTKLLVVGLQIFGNTSQSTLRILVDHKVTWERQSMTQPPQMAALLGRRVVPIGDQQIYSYQGGQGAGRRHWRWWWPNHSKSKSTGQAFVLHPHLGLQSQEEGYSWSAGNRIYPRFGRVFCWLAQGGAGAVEEAGVSSGQAHGPGGGGDHWSPAHKSLWTAAEGPPRSPAQQDPKLSRTNHRRIPIICSRCSEWLWLWLWFCTVVNETWSVPTR